jgi:flagellar motor switch protein FliN/FliY
MDQQTNNATARAFASIIAGALTESLGQAMGATCMLEITDNQSTPERNAPPVQFKIKVEGSLRGECFVEFYEPLLSDVVMQTTGVPSATPDDQSKALNTVVSSAMPALNDVLAAQYGEVRFKLHCVSGLAFGGMLMVPLALATDRSRAVALVYLDTALLDSISSASGTEQAPAAAGTASIHPANLKLVMDVELNVSLRFGQRQMPLREVLDLASGSVIELDRLVDEPVELLLDGKLVARGEAVIVDGNYGLRVTEIPQSVQSHIFN